MTKDIIVSVKGLQFTEEDDNSPVELITHGEYYKKNGKHYVFFEEISEDGNEKTKNMIKMASDFLDVTKKGAVNVHMMFEKEKKNISYYNTPFGSLLAGICGKEIKLKETEDNIDFFVQYALELNYQHVADCSIAINVKSGNSSEFRL